MGAAACGGQVRYCGERVNLLTCCDECVRDTGHNFAQPLLPDGVPGSEVELLVSPIAELHGVAGYHTSILVAGSEYFYGNAGIVRSPTISSHKRKAKMQRIYMGSSVYNGAELVAGLQESFPPGHYDLLRKNCNAFSDCALYFLCGQRLSWSFRGMDQIGILADNFGLIQSISAGEYTPNPNAVNFDLEAVVWEIGSDRSSRKLSTPMKLADDDLFCEDDLFHSSPGSFRKTLKNFSKLEAFPDTPVNASGARNLGGAVVPNTNTVVQTA